jgi:hypothetical protein
LSESVPRPSGMAPGMKPFHAVVGVVVAVIWVGLAVFVLTHGRGSNSSVDVYSELPPGFTAQLTAQGVQYQGLSPVDAATVKDVLSRAGAQGVVASDSNALVFRTSYSDTDKGRGAANNLPALMVVVPQSQSQTAAAPGAATQVFVEFVDPNSFEVLKTLTYGGGPVTPTPTPSP